MAIEFFDSSVGSPSGASAGIFIPISDLPGVVATEFGSGVDAAIKHGKAYAGIFNQVFGVVSPGNFDKLGIAVTKGIPSGTSNNTFTITYTLTGTYLNTVKDNTKQLLPIPTTGSNNGIGKFAIADVFTNAELVAADGAISGEGLLIPHTDLTEFGQNSAVTAIAAGQDNREWFAALYRWLSVYAAVRATGTTSAITAKSLGGTVGVTLGADATDATNPTTGILAADLPKADINSRQISFTVDFLLNQTTQTFDVNVA